MPNYLLVTNNREPTTSEMSPPDDAYDTAFFYHKLTLYISDLDNLSSFPNSFTYREIDPYKPSSSGTFDLTSVTFNKYMPYIYTTPTTSEYYPNYKYYITITTTTRVSRSKVKDPQSYLNNQTDTTFNMYYILSFTYNNQRINVTSNNLTYDVSEMQLPFATVVYYDYDLSILKTDKAYYHDGYSVSYKPSSGNLLNNSGDIPNLYFLGWRNTNIIEDPERYRRTRYT